MKTRKIPPFVSLALSRSLGGSAARWLGGVAARRPTGQVGKTPGPEPRRSARSDHQAELRILWPYAQAGLMRIQPFLPHEVSLKRVITTKKRPRPGVCSSQEQPDRHKTTSHFFKYDERRRRLLLCSAASSEHTNHHATRGTPGITWNLPQSPTIHA